MNCTIRKAKTKALVSCSVTAKLICAFVFALAKIQFSHDAALCYYYYYYYLARLHEVHRAIVVTSVLPVYMYVYVFVRFRVTLSVKVFYKSISLDHVDGSS